MAIIINSLQILSEIEFMAYYCFIGFNIAGTINAIINLRLIKLLFM